MLRGIYDAEATETLDDLDHEIEMLRVAMEQNASPDVVWHYLSSIEGKVSDLKIRLSEDAGPA